MPSLSMQQEPTMLLTKVERDAEGYLVHPRDWNEDIAVELASEENIELSENYWPIIEFIRESWQENNITPDIRHVTKHISGELDLDKKEAKKYLFKLFPYGYVKQACKIAGMQRPRAWSTG
jgi:tRNA 2-thiouridine synthesizing protein E